MTKSQLISGLRALGNAVNDDFTITVSGSGMFLLRDRLRREAGDCDLIAVDPQENEQVLFAEADALATQIGLEKGWLNSAMRDFGDEITFPDGWAGRTELYGQFGMLTVRCLSGRDAVALKAATTQERGDNLGDYEPDLTDLECADPSLSELDFAIAYLNWLTDQPDAPDYSRIVVGLMQLKDRARTSRGESADA